MRKKNCFCLFAGILVVLSLLFCSGNYDTGGVAYAQKGLASSHAPTFTGLPFEKPSPTGTLPVEGQLLSSSGWFNIVWGDGPEGVTETIYTLTDDNGQKTRLFLDETLSQSVGGVLWFDRKRVYVAGVWATAFSAQGAETALNVTAISLAPSPETGALSDDVSPAVIGSKPWVTIMCKFSDYAVEPHNLAYFSGMYSNIKPGLDHFWSEQSYNTANVAGSNASGWFVLPHTEAYYNPTDTEKKTNRTLLANECIAAADSSVNFSLYDGINMMFNTDFDNGWAWGGSMTMTLDEVTKSWSTTWEPPWAYANISVIQHEMGHGFGLPHSSTPWGKVYENAWDVMSQDRYNCAAATDPTYGCIAQHTISYHKDKLGWIPAGQRFTVAWGSSTKITLEQLALPATGNYKMARILIGGSSTHFYTVEARRLTGYDIKLAGAAVIVHEVDTTRSEPAWVVDTNGAPSSDAGAMWVVGETFVDAANNISVRVDEATATGFQVTIANNTTLPPDVPLSNGVASDQTMAAAVSQGTWNYYYIDLPSGSTNLFIDLYNLTADLDLYVRQGSKPTLSTYNCRSWTSGSTGESCSFSSPASGRWWIGVLNWEIGSIFYKIKASWCNYDISSTSRTVDMSSGSGSVSVTASAGTCPWTATSNAAWITVTSGSPGTGNGTVNYTYAANNAGSTRTGTITVAGKTFTLTQQPLSADTPLSNGVALDQTMTAYVSKGTWNYYYIDLPSGSTNLVIDLYNLTADLDLYVRQGSKPTQSSYDCRSWYSGTTGESCSFSSPASGRWWIGVLNWEIGSIFYKIKASWCNYDISSTSRTVDMSSGSGSVSVTASAGTCPWTATSNAAWITVTSRNPDTGNGTVHYTYTANNTRSTRTGTITVAGQTFTLTQKKMAGLPWLQLLLEE